MLAITGLIFSTMILAVHGSDCLCASVDLQASKERGSFVLPHRACAEITDRITGTNHIIWYFVKYNNKTGWIPEDKSKMSFSQCSLQDHYCRDLSAACTATDDICQNYQFWAYKFCRKHCNLCDVQPTMCVDEEFECVRYGKSVCTDYTQWAHQKCRSFCGFCGDECLDTEKDCAAYSKSVCTEFPQWSLKHCQKFCNLCDVTPSPSTTTTTTTTTAPSTAAACRDQDGIDCSWLDSMTGVCKEHASANEFCPKYCKICDTGDAQAVVGK